MFKHGGMTKTSSVIRSSALCLVALGALSTQSACTFSHDPRAKAEKPVCVAVLTNKLNCENEPLAYSETNPHSDFDQQMLPVNQRKDMIESELEDNRRNR
ncbi:hypothetical protein [Alteromonas stellipolaris]|jgi:hypothetical protein|uniref:Lipoprotein n=1 Tax=Alteromonas stellipolaris TaxID=233316 RepID=A0ABN4LPP8_9ALTE|nr:hypothetical protein [Alteromonas stellipolaris]ALM90265.1 hypothetical protein AOR13_1222 [Alteromonas stellipolaris LMG 21856]AMJ74720.1 hypothetical protein AVL57_12560 [Alteromonas stellipolaris]MBZ2163360.1 hypothetical protein [Alteromonas stellipolaris]